MRPSSSADSASDVTAPRWTSARSWWTAVDEAGRMGGRPPARSWWTAPTTSPTACACPSARAAGSRTSSRGRTTASTSRRSPWSSARRSAPTPWSALRSSHTPDGRWRLYVSIATPGTKHWRVDVLEAGTVEGLATATPRTVLPGSDDDGGQGPGDPARRPVAPVGVVHPLDDLDHTDRMTTEYATSPDGIDWTWQGTALAGAPTAWDARGVRITAVLDGSRPCRVLRRPGHARRRTTRSAPASPSPTGPVRRGRRRAAAPEPPPALRPALLRRRLPAGRRGPLVLRGDPERRRPRAAHRPSARLTPSAGSFLRTATRKVY